MHLKKKRAFHSMITIEKGNGEELMLALGGYDGDHFLDSIEVFDPTGAKSWEAASVKLNESRSHFCTVYYKVR